MPIFVDRQLIRHTVGFVRSELSRRYIDSEPSFYITDKLGAKAENKKQGAKEGEFVTSIGNDSTYNMSGLAIREVLNYKWETDLQFYNLLLSQGVAPEDARVVLPLATNTEYYLTGSLYAFARIYNLRVKPDAQRQTQEVAQMISNIVEPLFPYSWSALCQKD